jgi:hypothetical protein
MSDPSYPPLSFTPTAGSVWAEALCALSGYMVAVTDRNGAVTVGELLGDGRSGRYVRLLVGGQERVLLSSFLVSIEFL